MNNSNIAELHANSMHNIDKIKQLLAESDESGSRTLEQLSIDKEKLLKVRNNVDEVNNKVGISRRIIRKMNWEDDKKKNYRRYKCHCRCCCCYHCCCFN